MPTSGISSDDRVLGSSGNQYNAVFTDKTDNSQLSQSDFLKLMVAQLQNQDFTDPMDNSDMVNQMVQFSNMQQMQEMAGYAKSSYAMSLLGQTVTASRFTVNGDLDTTTGPVQRVSLVDNEYVLYIGGKKYTMAQIMGVSGESSADEGISTEGYSLKADKITSDSATLTWEVPTEDEYAAGDLTYTVYYSENKLETLEEVEQATQYGSSLKDATSETIKNLEPGVTYYANVVVTDASGKKSIYQTVTFRTEQE